MTGHWFTVHDFVRTVAIGVAGLAGELVLGWVL